MLPRLRIVPVLAVVLGGCATLSVVPAGVAGIRSAALAGFSLEDRTSNEVEEGGPGAIVDRQRRTWQTLAGAGAREARAVYEQVAGRLAAGTGWRFALLDEIAGNAEYARHVPAFSGPIALVAGLAPGIVPGGGVGALGAARRAELCRSLGVDALADVHVVQRVGRTAGFSFEGVGRLVRYPRATIELRVWAGGGPDPVWVDTAAEGEPAARGFELVMGVRSNEGESEALAEATESALVRLLERYAAARGRAQAAATH